MELKGGETDEQIVSAVRAGDKEKYGEIIRRYETRLSHYLRKFFSDRDELEDVLQEVFIKAFRNLNDFDADRKFSPWIYRITRNEAINFIKKYSKEAVSIDEKEWDIVDKSMNLDEKIDRSFNKEMVERGLAKMKSKYREPLILYFFEGLSYAEISEILKIPINSVGVLVMRGKKILKDLIGARGINKMIKI